jgi:prepilin-type N-terminal cleavage/methylation domain-containing protein
MLKIFRKKGQKGFTLPELIVVVFIIAILATMALQQFVTYRKKAYNMQAKAELHGFYTACKAYFADSPTTTTCSLALVAATFITSGDVIFANIPANQTLAGTTAAHVAGTSTYTLSAGGNITP